MGHFLSWFLESEFLGWKILDCGKAFPEKSISCNVLEPMRIYSS